MKKCTECSNEVPPTRAGMAKTCSAVCSNIRHGRKRGESAKKNKREKAADKAAGNRDRRDSGILAGLLRDAGMTRAACAAAAGISANHVSSLAKGAKLTGNTAYKLAPVLGVHPLELFEMWKRQGHPVDEGCGRSSTAGASSMEQMAMVDRYLVDNPDAGKMFLIARFPDCRPQIIKDCLGRMDEKKIRDRGRRVRGEKVSEGETLRMGGKP